MQVAWARGYQSFNECQPILELSQRKLVKIQEMDKTKQMNWVVVEGAR